MKKIYSLLLMLFICNIIYSQNEGTFKDQRDGREYKWVKMGKQVWMAENLAYLPAVYSIYDKQTHGYRNHKYDMVTLDTPYQFVPGYDVNDINEAKKSSYYKTYGVLYNYASALKSCPAGWHIPSDAEWKELEIFIGIEKESIDKKGDNRGNVSIKIKSKTLWRDDVKGNDEYGFCALPAGIMLQDNSFKGGAKFIGLGEATSFWTSTENKTMIGNITALRRGIDNRKGGLIPANNKGILRFPIIKSYGISVRCVKDDE